MLDDWKRAWRQAVENFQREMADGGAPRVAAMQRELTSAGGALHRLDEEIRRTQREADSEQAAREVCVRREHLAREAGDDETARIATEYAARHGERAAVLHRKIEVLQDERALLARDVESMRQMVADTPGADLNAGASDNVTGGAGSSTGPGGTPRSATRDAEDHAAHVDFSRLEREARERSASERLEELKRRMNQG